jgi:hypothetical protein
VEYGIEMPGNKLLALAELDCNTWVSEVKRLWGEKQPLAGALSAFRFLLSAFPISALPPTHPPPRRQNLETGAHVQG